MATNLIHQQLWTDVTEFDAAGFHFCRGTPAKQLHPADPVENGLPSEVVLCASTDYQWTAAQWALAFDAARYAGHALTRLLMAIETDDSTVVYYLVYDGLQAPRKN